MKRENEPAKSTSLAKLDLQAALTSLLEVKPLAKDPKPKRNKAPPPAKE